MFTRMSQAALILILAVVAAVASAQSANTQRALRNIEIALTLDVPEAFKAGDIPPGKEFQAKTLAKDLDERMPRVHDTFDRIDAADKTIPAVVAMGKRIADMERIRVKLGSSVATQGANTEAAKTQHFAFMKELGIHEPVIMRFGEITADHDRDIMGNVNPETFKKWLDELAVVDAACTTKYKGIQNHPTYSLNRLQTSPGDWCKIAAQRGTYSRRAVANHVAAMSARRLKDLQELAKAPEKNDGYLMNWIVTAVSEPDSIKPALVAEATPWFAVAGMPLPDGYFSPVDKLAQDAIAALDRMAPTWPYPADQFHDGRIEGIVQHQMAAGVKVVRTSLAAGAWTIDKNALGVVLDRYRTGHILFQMPKLKWCSLREFTYLESHTGGGTFAPAASATLSEAVRFQSCK